jgi:hypothetical protein
VSPVEQELLTPAGAHAFTPGLSKNWKVNVFVIFGGKTTKDLQQYIHHLTKENLCFNNDYN